jgi:hypothetical protein
MVFLVASDAAVDRTVLPRLMHFHNCDRPKMNCHSDPELAEGEESPHFARCATAYTIGKTALLDDWHL